MKTISIVTISLMLCSCASITSGTTQSFTVITPYAEGASCDLVDAKGARWYVKKTPETATIKKGDGPLTITCRKPGYNTAVTSVDETVAGATFGNILAGGLIGVGVDAMTGAAQHYPDQTSVWLEPQQWSSTQFQTAWRAEKAEYDRKLEEARKAEESYNNDRKR